MLQAGELSLLLYQVFSIYTARLLLFPTPTWKIAIMYNNSEITLIREVAGMARLDDGDDNHHSY